MEGGAAARSRAVAGCVGFALAGDEVSERRIEIPPTRQSSVNGEKREKRTLGDTRTALSAQIPSPDGRTPMSAHFAASASPFFFLPLFSCYSQSLPLPIVT